MKPNDQDYDIDNIDIEEEMFRRDVEEENEQLAEEREQVEAEEADRIIKKNCSLLNAKNLSKDVTKCENNKTTYSWYNKSNPKIIYTGVVVHKLDDDAFIFEITTEEGKKLKKFRLSEIKQQI